MSLFVKIRDFKMGFGRNMKQRTIIMARIAASNHQLGCHMMLDAPAATTPAKLRLSYIVIIMKPLSVYRLERLVDKIMIIGSDLILKHRVSAFILYLLTYISLLCIFYALFSTIIRPNPPTMYAKRMERCDARLDARCG